MSARFRTYTWWCSECNAKGTFVLAISQDNQLDRNIAARLHHEGHLPRCTQPNLTIEEKNR